MTTDTEVKPLEVNRAEDAISLIVGEAVFVEREDRPLIDSLEAIADDRHGTYDKATHAAVGHAEMEQLRADARRYRWIKSRRSIDLRTDNCSRWMRPDGTIFVPTYYLAADDMQFSPESTLDESIDAAQQENES